MLVMPARGLLQVAAKLDMASADSYSKGALTMRTFNIATIEFTSVRSILVVSFSGRLRTVVMNRDSEDAADANLWLRR